MHFAEFFLIVGYAIEAVGVFVIVAGMVISSVSYLRNFRKMAEGQAYLAYRRQLGRSIILGLEFLIAGDIVRTVVAAETLENVGLLGLIILIRAFLTMSLHVEVEGRWPWQNHTEKTVAKKPSKDQNPS
ncbi:DUF1622 domain-containing protein [Rheinheimera sp. UJ63]|uniref:DUF1622 domain-containing protein n=1 Tax=Rheinheimera sp. UJ63 TaxID=2910157 RepID=UPI001F472401|nr:DUF1622 domain-containing protein [Rheinheimera sp. UJ63]MCF4009539.1 DUF1622 domain-containing protein [Rheinheimera sp. UJ63]